MKPALVRLMPDGLPMATVITLVPPMPMLVGLKVLLKVAGPRTVTSSLVLEAAM